MSTPSRRQLLLILTVLAGTSLGGCWRQRQLTVQEEGKSYLRLIGALEGIELALDDGERKALLDSGGGTAEEGTLWEVLPGRHLVELYRYDRQVLRRDLYVGPGQVLDVAIPE